MTTPNMEILARAFSAELRKEIGDDNLAMANTRNTVAAPGVCHSHDFCDANMVMDLAWRALFGREVRLPCDVEAGNCTEAESDHDLNRWNAAWDLAKANEFYV